MTNLPAVYHPLTSSSPLLPKERISLGAYRGLMFYLYWNRAIALVRKAKAWELAIEGAGRLIELTEFFKPRLREDEYRRNEIKVYLFWLDSLKRVKRLEDYDALWKVCRRRKDLWLLYESAAVASRERIREFYLKPERRKRRVHFLYLVGASPKVTSASASSPRIAVIIKNQASNQATLRGGQKVV